MQKPTMFSVIDDPLVRLMIDLCPENRREKVELSERLKNVDLITLFQLCAEHELEGVVASHILEDGLIQLPQEWLSAYQYQKEKQSFLRDEAAEVCKYMNDNGIPMVILKNGGIMLDMIDDPAACPMEDIDSLVKKSDFHRAHELLKDRGYIFKFRSEYEKEELESAFLDGSTEYYIMSPNHDEIWFELSWRPVAGRWIRQDLEPDTDELMSHASYSEDKHAGVLSPEDNLLQVCIHTAKHSYVRSPGLRLHLDVERIVTHKQIDWDMFLKKIESTHVKNAVFFSLLIPYTFWHTPIPEYVLETLKPKRKKYNQLCNLLASAGLLYPKKTKFTKLSFLRFQTALYDSKEDMMKVLYPGSAWMKEHYGIKSRWMIPDAIIKRGLDLVGIRKKKAGK